jgi:transglutaminase-like putative cysteine protease
VSTRATAVWEAGAGVCQDLVHLGLGALRSVGIPARYVSGYVMPAVNPVVGEATTGESHAWLQYWDGAWVGLDPTNNTSPGDFHVEVGVGRDYFDVTPLKGVYSGSQASDLFVEVEMTVLA